MLIWLGTGAINRTRTKPNQYQSTKSKKMNIRLIKHADLDKNKWSSAVHYSTRGNIYGYWWYLTNTVKEWDGIVEGEYETVFPLIPVDSDVLASNELVPELGIYSVNVLSEKRVRAILSAIPDQYKKYNFRLNAGVKVPTDMGFMTSTRINHQLMLDKPYEELEEHYSDHQRRELAKALSSGVAITSNVKPEALADFYKEYTTDKNVDFNFHAYQRIMYNALHRGIGFASAIITREQEYLAMGFFLFTHGKVMRLFSFESPKGKSVGANALLFDMLLRTNAGRPVLLDFNDFGQDSFALDFGAQRVSVVSVGLG